MKLLLSKKHIKSQQEKKGQYFLVSVIFMTLVFMLSFSKQSVSQTVPGKAYSLFGNPMCSEWAVMSVDSKFAWTSGFLSTLSMGHETSRRVGAQKFKDQQGLEKIVAVIDRHCAANPDAQASEAAAPFLN